MNARRNRFASIAAVAIAATLAIVAGCDSSTSSPAASTPSVSATPSPSPTPPPTPTATAVMPEPSWSGSPLPGGVTAVDVATNIESLDWSPDDKLLAVVASGAAYGSGRVDVLDAEGNPISSFFAFKACWVDATHMMTLVVSTDSTGLGTATLQPVDGSEGSVVPGQFSAIVCNEHGLVAMSDAVVEYPGFPGFRIWSNGSLGSRIDVRGSPVEWSPDGQYLAIVDLDPAGSQQSRLPGTRVRAAAVMPNLVLGAAGGQWQVVATVMRFPDQAKLVPGLILQAPGITTRFSPDSSSIVLSPTEVSTSAATTHSVVIALPGIAKSPIKAGLPQGWTPSGKLILVDDQRHVSLWTQAGATLVPKAYRSAVFGPDEADYATLNATTGSQPPTATVRHGNASVVVPLGYPVLTATWASSGVCFIATAGTAHTETAYLLRVDLR